ncbi:hypothetical protein [Methanoregula sp.]|jgi:hypothetical protein|uniref:hypothetical protein n=1 Tax=Methanoregula sp. TaxID=2052170 RepID=UPI003C29139D
MKKTSYILICVVFSLLFLCGVANAVNGGENGLVNPGQPGVCSDRLVFLNNTIFDLKAGEEQDIMIDFYRPYCFYDYGTGNVSYTVSDTPLNVTVPSEFITTPNYRQYPGMIKVHADPNLSPGKYSFSLTVIGTQGSFICTPNSTLFINVTPREGLPLLQQLSPLPILLPVFALVVICVFWRQSYVKGK